MTRFRPDPGTWISALTLFFGCSAAGLTVALAYSLCVPYAQDIAARPVAGRGEGNLLPWETVKIYQSRPFRLELFRQKKLFDCQDSSGENRPERPPQEALLLLGVSLGERRLAVIRDEAQRREYYVAEGDWAAGFQVETIEKDRVVLKAKGKTLELVK